jgi:HAD superfamily hydrolase (TIGR01509 family)
MGILIDLDQTLINSQAAQPLRRTRDWSAVYQLIPQLLPYPGISELLEELRVKRIPICIITSSPRPYCQRIIDHWGWQVDATVCYHDTSEWKPKPAPIVKGLERLGLEAAEVVAIGDAANDIKAARAAGVFSIGALWGSLEKKLLQDSNPDVICHKVSDLRDIILTRYGGFLEFL